MPCVVKTNVNEKKASLANNDVESKLHTETMMLVCRVYSVKLIDSNIVWYFISPMMRNTYIYVHRY